MQEATSSSRASYRSDPPPFLEDWNSEEENPLNEYEYTEEMEPPPVKRRKLGDVITENPVEFVLPPVSSKYINGQLTYKTWTRGTHTYSSYEYVLYPLNGPIPIKNLQSRQKTKIDLPLLESKTKRRPLKTDLSFLSYIERCIEKPEYCDLGHGYISSTKALPVLDYEKTRHIAVSCVRETFCQNCSRKLERTGKQNPEKGKNYRVCCFRAPRYNPVNLSPLKLKYTKIYTLTYDIESYPVDGIHKFFCIATKKNSDPSEIRWNVDAFYKDLSDMIKKCDPQENSLIHLVSFNGSRYDDIFLTEKWRQFIIDEFGIAAFKNINYSERKRAITHQTARITHNLTIEWCDVSRFIPPSSLKKAAMDNKLAILKGNMPFEVLNDFASGKKIVRGDDGFFHLDYFQGDKDLQKETLEYYIQVLGFHPAERPPRDFDVQLLTVEYCKQDVDVTYLLYKHQESMFKAYLSPLVEGDQDKGFFEPMLLHSMASMAARVMIHNALHTEHTIYNTDDGSTRRGKVELFAPVDETYTFERNCIYGGWTRPYYQGLVLDRAKCVSHMGEAWTSKLETLCKIFDTAVQDEEIIMGDIASMHPNAITDKMPIGQGVLITSEERKKEIWDQLMAETNPGKIPLFAARVKVCPPKSPYFFESTLPQRRNDKNLAWTYSEKYAEEYAYYTSRDLWIACVGSKQYDDPRSVWTLVDIKEMVYWKEGAAIYAPYMIGAIKIKTDGAAEGNDSKKGAGKNGANCSVGKLNQNAAGQKNVIGKRALYDNLRDKGHEVEIVGQRDITYQQGYLTVEDVEYILKTTDSRKNTYTQIHAAFMYGSTRWMREEWARASGAGKVPLKFLSMIPVLPDDPEFIKQMLFDYHPPLACPATVEWFVRAIRKKHVRPYPYYGDTDSKIETAENFSNIPKEMLGTRVGVFDLEKGVSNQNIDLEKVSTAETDVLVTGILGSKTYFMASRKKKSPETIMKFRCKGQRQFNPKTGVCQYHLVQNCKQCICRHREYKDNCLECSVNILWDLICHAAIAGNPIDHVNTAPPLTPPPFNLDKFLELDGLTFLAFLFTLITGVSCVTTNSLFDRTLSLSTSKLPSYTIKNRSQLRTLSKPSLKSHVNSTFSRLTPHIADGVEQNNDGVLFPLGEYLL